LLRSFVECFGLAIPGCSSSLENAFRAVLPFEARGREVGTSRRPAGTIVVTTLDGMHSVAEHVAAAQRWERGADRTIIC